MNFPKNQFSEMVENTTYEKTKYIGLLNKLHMVLDLDSGHKLISDASGDLLFTESPVKLYEKINYKHPVLNIFRAFLNKFKYDIVGMHMFTKISRQIVECVLDLLNNEIRPIDISEALNGLVEDLGENFEKILEDIVGKDAKNMGNGIQKIELGTKEGHKIEIEGELDLKQESPDGGTQWTSKMRNIKRYVHSVVQNRKVTDLLMKCIEDTGNMSRKQIRVFKVPTGYVEDSYVVDGLVVNRGLEGKIKKLDNTTIGVFDVGLELRKTEGQSTALFEKAEDLYNFTRNEMKTMEDLVNSFNTNIICVNGPIDYRMLELADRRHIAVLRITNGFDLERLCDVTGISLCSEIGPVKNAVYVKKIEEFEDAGFKFTKVIGNAKISTIILKNNIRVVIDDMEDKINGILDFLSSLESYEFTDTGVCKVFYEVSQKECPIKDMVVSSLCRIEEAEHFVHAKIEVLRSSLEFLSLLLEVDDYLVMQPDKLNIKPPARAEHWDNGGC